MSEAEITIIRHADGTFGVDYSKPLQEAIECDYDRCACRYKSYVWISHRLKALYFMANRCASSAIRQALRMSGKDEALQAIIWAVIYHERALGQPIKIRLEEDHASSCVKENGKKMMLDYYHLESEIRREKNFLRNNAPVIRSGEVRSVKKWRPFRWDKYGFSPLFLRPEQAVAQFPDYISFAVYRDPVTRMLSAWKMFTGVPVQRRCASIGMSDANIPFDSFLENAQTFRNHHYDKIAHFVPRKRSGKVNLDFIIRFEHLRLDWERLARTLGVQTPLRNPNKSQYDEAQDTISTRTRRVIEEMFREDYEAFS
jgi:hypothetical protein